MRINANKKNNYIAVFIVFVLSALLSVFFVRHEYNKTKTNAELALAAQIAIMTGSLRDGIDYSDSLAAVLVIEDGTSRSDAKGALTEDVAIHFDAVAETILKNQGCRYVQFLEGTTLKYAYPKSGGWQKDIGRDITKLDYSYTLARLTNKVVTEGPLKQYNEDVFLVIRPIFKTKEDGGKLFWGEAAIAMDSSYVLNTLKLDLLTQHGYEYELWAVDPLNGSKKQIQISTQGVDFSKAIETKFELPTVWTLSIIPKGGWLNKELIFILAFFTAAITMCAALVFNFYRKKKALEGVFLNASKYDNQTGLLTEESLIFDLEKWALKPEECFELIYIVLNDYRRIIQLCTQEQKNELLWHIRDTLENYVKAEHLVARVGEADFVLAVKDNSSESELANMCKGLMIELIMSVELDGKREFLTADCEYISFPKGGTKPGELLRNATLNYYRRVK